jgi:hypothetical protein
MAVVVSVPVALALDQHLGDQTHTDIENVTRQGNRRVAAAAVAGPIAIGTIDLLLRVGMN